MPQNKLEDKIQYLKEKKEEIEKKDDPSYNKILEQIIESLNFLISLRINNDSSISFEREGKLHICNNKFIACYDNKTPGIPNSEQECVGKIAHELCYKEGDLVKYLVTVYPKYPRI